MKSYEKPGHYKGDADPQVERQDRGKSMIGKKRFAKKSKKHSQKTARK